MKTHTSVGWRKRRTGMWCSTGQGSGSVQDTGNRSSGQSDDDDDGEDGDESLSPEDQIKKANDEAKRRRLQARDLRQENERLKAQVANNGATGDDSGPDRSEVILSLVEAGLSRDRIRAAMRLIDWSSVDDVEDAIDDLRADHKFLFDQSGSSGDNNDNDLPPQGSKGNRDRNRTTRPDNNTLYRKYPALGGGAFGGKLRP